MQITPQKALTVCVLNLHLPGKFQKALAV